jgi:hypothetical protein
MACIAATIASATAAGSGVMFSHLIGMAQLWVSPWGNERIGFW